MNKKIILGLTSICVVAVALAVFVFYVRRDDADGKFSVLLEPDEITIRVGEYRNLTITIVSTGYEGNLKISDPTYSWTGEKPLTTLEHKIIPGNDEPNARLIEADGELALMLQIRWMGLPRTLYLKVEVYGNYQQENEFKVSSNLVTITIKLPT